jgi:hypothetical protein
MGASNCTGNGGSDCCAETRRTCCEIQGNENKIRGVLRGFPQPPTGFSYFNSTTKAKEASASKWHRASSASNASNASNEKANQLMADRMLQVLRTAPGSSDHTLQSRRQSGNQAENGSFRRIPWKQEIPDPLPDWTQADQQILIDILEDYPRAGRDDSQLELALVKAMKMLPHRTGPDCHRCFKHIHGSRVAFFGK